VASAEDVRVALLGLGNVGSAVARLALSRPDALGRTLRLTGALVRNPSRPRRPDRVPVTTSHADLLADRPDVVIEVLGGLEPARTIVLEAIARGIPVVTANKSLLAHHGGEILEAAAAAGVPLCYEASVLAGVPFLGTFARRPLASRVSSLTGIVNGTTNFILTEMARRSIDLDSALAHAQHLGLAEPDPSMDVDGIDAAEKLAILIRHFAQLDARCGHIETTGIRHVTAGDIRHAHELGGTMKLVASAAWSGTALTAHVGPSFVPSAHPLARVNGATNSICLQSETGTALCFTGPGAGPDVTAVTILDDVVDALAGDRVSGAAACTRRAVHTTAPTSWFIRLTSPAALPHGADIADLLGAYGVWIQRASSRDVRNGSDAQWLITYPCPRGRIEAALAALAAASGSSSSCFRALEDPRD
jgi:homoserine dehydrogenase